MIRKTVLGLAASLALAAGSSSALAQGTAITYQGQLKNSGAAVNSATDMQFSLWTLATGGSQVGSTVTSLAVPVSEGLFTAPMDFGVNPYTSSQNLYLQVAVRNPAGSGSYVPMGTRQLLTPSHFSLATRGINVDALGKVGIGTNAPFPGYGSNGTWQGLDINNPNAGGAGLAYLRGDAVSRLVLQARNNTADFRQFRLQNFANSMQFGWMGDSLNDPTPAIAIDTNSNVGVTGAPATADTRFTIHQGYTPLGSQRTNLFLNQPQCGWGTGAEFNNYRYIKTDACSNNEGFFKQFNVAPGGVSIGYPNTPVYNSTDAMYINGKVGIGTNAPQSALQVRGGIQTVNPTAGIHMGLDGGATGAAILSIVGTNGFASLEFHGDSTQNDFGARILYNQADGSLASQGASKFSVNVLEIRGGSDLVEGFDSQTAELEPGTLMVIDPAHPGQLMPSTSAYDSKVAGIVSGANGVNPGIKMGQDGVMDGKNPIAMTGRVYVKATTANGAIKPGDLLTTSDLSGHAMKASDAGKSQGTVVGKAMSALDKDTGLVLVLVNLQ